MHIAIRYLLARGASLVCTVLLIWQFTRSLLRMAGVVSKKITHIFRGYGARMMLMESMIAALDLTRAAPSSPPTVPPFSPPGGVSAAAHINPGHPGMNLGPPRCY